MSEKRFKQFGLWIIDDTNSVNSVADLIDTKLMSTNEVVDLLNEQDEKIKVLQNNCEIMNQRLSEKSKCDYKKAIIEFCNFMNIDTPLLEVMVDEFLQEVF